MAAGAPQGRHSECSANATKRPPAVIAPKADASLSGRLLVIDGDPARDPGQRHGSATMVRISSGGDLSLARHGINDELFPGTTEEYLTDLRRRYDHQSIALADLRRRREEASTAEVR